MKKTLIALASLSVLSGVAHAQSSVTLYGIIDDGLNYISNSGGQRLFNMSAGVVSGSRFGLRGEEDLGGGMKAVFVLENGFDENSGKLGQGGLLFGRQAFVGLASNRFGSVTLGRQYDSLADYIGPFIVGDQWGGYVAAHPGDLDNFNNSFRNNNTIKYRSATIGGLTVGATYSFGGVAGQITQNQNWSLGAGYVNGPLSVSVAYLNARTPNTTGGLFSGAVSTPVYVGYTSANTYQVIGAGAAYTIGAATFGATYSNVKFMNLGATSNSAFQRGETVTFNNAEINFKYQATPALLLGAAFDYTHGSSVTASNGVAAGGARYYQAELVSDYFLSKRTDVYVLGVFQQASGTDSENQPAVAAINQLTPSKTNRQAIIRFGYRHKF